MLKKEEFLWVSDNTNVQWVKIFHIYNINKLYLHGVGNYVYASNRYQILNFNKISAINIKLRKSRNLVIRIKNNILINDSSAVTCFDNAAVAVSSALKVYSSNVAGYTLRNMGILKILVLFKFII